MQGGFFAGEGDELGVGEAEDYFVGEGGVREGDGGGADGGGEAGVVLGGAVRGDGDGVAGGIRSHGIRNIPYRRGGGASFCHYRE